MSTQNQNTNTCKKLFSLVGRRNMRSLITGLVISYCVVRQATNKRKLGQSFRPKNKTSAEKQAKFSDLILRRSTSGKQTKFRPFNKRNLDRNLLSQKKGKIKNET